MTASIPTVSVCMITYNHERHIAKAIEGLLMQKTDFPIELVIGEDKSTDNTYAICCDYESKYPEIIRVLKRDSNIGMIKNFIDTLLNCRGQYVALCEGDDYWISPLKLQYQKNYLETNNLVMNFHHGHWVNTDGEIFGPQSPLPEVVWDFNALLNRWPLTASLFFEKKALIPLPDIFYKTYSGDQVLMLIIASKGKIDIINEYWCNHIVIDSGVTATTNKAAWILNRIYSLHGINIHTNKVHNRELNAAISKLHFHFAQVQTTKTVEKFAHIIKGIFTNQRWDYEGIRIMAYEIRTAFQKN